MANIEEYRNHIQTVIKQHTIHPPTYGEVEMQMIFDEAREHYQLVHAGWDGNRRKYGCLIHLDIKDGKIWVQYDGTEVGVANELVALGVPKEDIVLAYHPAYIRPQTDFATA